MSKRNRPVTSHGLRAPSNPSTLPPYLVGLTETPVSSSSPGLSSTLQPSLGYVPIHPNSTGALLAPEAYLSDQRASPVSDAMDSIYTWSSASEAEMLRTSASVDPVYFDFDSQQSIGQPIPPMGLTPQDINQWCINSHSTGFQTTSYPAISSSYLPAEPAEMCQQDYTLNENMTTPAHTQWHIPTDNYLSPVPAVSVSTFDTNSVMSTSPTPTTISDLDILVLNLHNSPTSPTDLTRYGIPTGDGAWRCAYPGCTSQALFRRGCDLRKHFNRHRKHLFCRHEGCPQSRHGGFSSKKDRARHEAKHNPGIVCEWEGCGRVFSRVDNMRDHLRRIHRRGASR
ncbi:C2H2 type zinc finger domain protein [Penicillium lividum]|nr:C2H2 type zinc finger domain protein [Penicillium lividum]